MQEHESLGRRHSPFSGLQGGQFIDLIGNTDELAFECNFGCSDAFRISVVVVTDMMLPNQVNSSIADL